MSGTLTPPSSINDLRTQAHLIIGERLANLPVQNVLDYVISNADSTVLPFLTWQFDMQSQFWQLLAPGLTQQQLIEQSIALHRFRGTVYSITQSLTNLGFPNATVLEGQSKWGGNSWPSSEGWAVFRVVIPVSSVTVSTTVQNQVLDAVLFFKPQRCWLDSIQWANNLTDNLSEPGLPILADRITYVAKGVVNDILFPIPIDTPVVPLYNPFIEVKAINPLHNSHFYHSGGFYYGTGNPAVVDSGIVVNGTQQV